jgi:hypothetical protein
MNEEGVRLHSRFVAGIGSLLDTMVATAIHLKKFEETITPVGGMVEIDMVESTIKLRIAQPVWQGGMSFEDFVEYVQHPKTQEKGMDGSVTP